MSGASNGGKHPTKADLALENAYLRAALTLIGLNKLTGIPVPTSVSAFACLVVLGEDADDL